MEQAGTTWPGGQLLRPPLQTMVILRVVTGQANARCGKGLRVVGSPLCVESSWFMVRGTVWLSRTLRRPERGWSSGALCTKDTPVRRGFVSVFRQVASRALRGTAGASVGSVGCPLGFRRLHPPRSLSALVSRDHSPMTIPRRRAWSWLGAHPLTWGRHWPGPTVGPQIRLLFFTPLPQAAAASPSRLSFRCQGCQAVLPVSCLLSVSYLGISVLLSQLVPPSPPPPIPRTVHKSVLPSLSLLLPSSRFISTILKKPFAT